MIALSGADIVLPDRVVRGGSIVIDQGRIAAIEPRAIDAGAGRTVVDLANHIIVPGFVDVHVHGIEGVDVLDGPDAVDDVAKRLPKYGVTAFCPTSVACTPARLTTLLAGVARARSAPAAAAARVLPAHLESNFINPEWNGAQPIHCLRTYKPQGKRPEGDFAGHEILQAIVSNRAERRHRHARAGNRRRTRPGSRSGDGRPSRVARPHRRDLRPGARCDRARRASCDASLQSHVVADARDRRAWSARCSNPMRSRPRSSATGITCIPSLVAVAIRVKSVSRMMAITDATAVAGLPAGSRARLGDQTIIAGEKTAVLENGTIAGSILTMDAAFRMLVKRVGLSLPDAARMCATTPAEAMKAADIGAIAPGKWADLTVLDRDLRVSRVFVGGEPAGNSVPGHSVYCPEVLSY